MKLEQRMERGRAILQWVSGSIAGLRIPGLPTRKRIQLAVPCFHAAIRHQQAVICLVDDDLAGSALALGRVVVEAYARGLWLAVVATEDEVDAAGRDEFPGFGVVVRALETNGDGHLSVIKGAIWSRLCSYTHGGYGQIGARLSESGVDDRFPPEEVEQVVYLSNFCALASACGIAELSENKATIAETLKRLKEEMLAS